jgi:antitoxin (DNA-binding transcriptional repressor) of toxin-antitoxin stability system
MATVSIEDAQSRLKDLIAQMTPGDEIFITDGDRTIARLIAEVPCEKRPRRLGTLKGTVLYMAPDFDAPLDDFKEYRCYAVDEFSACAGGMALVDSSS